MTSAAPVSRRQFLGRTAVVGGLLVWTVPTVQVLAGGKAFAATGSAGPTPPATGGNPLPPVVLGETFTNNPPATVEATSAGRVSGTLPFTGVNAAAATEVAAGAVAAGALLRYVGRRRPEADAPEG